MVLDPLQKETIYNAFRQLVKEKSKTILFSTHILNEIEGLCDSIITIHNGVKKDEIHGIKDFCKKNNLHDLFVTYQ